MRVDDTNNTGSVNASLVTGARSTQATEETARGRTAERSGVLREDSVQLSGLASKLAGMDVSSPDRVAFVDRLHALVSSGKYQPDIDAVADALIQEAMGGGTYGIQGPE